MARLHKNAFACPVGWRETTPAEYNRGIRTFRCGCDRPDMHLVREEDPAIDDYLRYDEDG